MVSHGRQGTRTAFQHAGFTAVEPSYWASSGLSTFTVHVPAERGRPDGRVVMAIVYPDAASAQAVVGRTLIPGYGNSTVRGNVALVQSAWGELDRI